MRGASRLFSRYEPRANEFVVDGAKVLDSMAGIYKIAVEATFVDPKGQT